MFYLKVKKNMENGKMLLPSVYKEKNNFIFISSFLMLFILYSHSFILFSGREISNIDGAFFFNITYGQIDRSALAINMFFLIREMYIFTLTLIFSILSWHFIEKISLKFAHRKKIKCLFILGTR